MPARTTMSRWRSSGKAFVEPLIPNIVQGIHEAFSIAIGSTFWVGIVGALIALACVAFLREEPMRTSFEFEDE